MASKATCRCVGLAMGGLLASSSPGFAQERSPIPVPSETVTVIAPYLVRKVRALNENFQPIYSITIERAVTYGDLDLRKGADAREFERRIRSAAESICKQMEHLYPSSAYVPISGPKNCAAAATNEGLARAKDVIAAYGNQPVP